MAEAQINEAPNYEYFYIYFDSDNTYTVMIGISEHLRLIDEDNVQVNFKGKWFNGKIRYRGTKEKCEKKAKKHNDGEFTDVEDFNVLWNKKKKTNNTIHQRQQILKINSIERITQITDEINKFKSADDEGKVLNELKRKIDDLKDEITELKELIPSIKEGLLTVGELLKKKTKKHSEEWLSEVMFENKNLLSIDASALNKYITRLMEILFSKKELCEGLIYDGNTTSKREKLDPEKVQILKSAVINKYKITDEEKAFKEIKKVANKKCHDTTRKYFK